MKYLSLAIIISNVFAEENGDDCSEYGNKDCLKDGS